MNVEKYLPIGSVVLLKNGKKRVMVTGFVAVAKETKDRIFDYMGCLYPEGVISSDKNLLFDHDQIDKIYYMGYRDEEWQKVEDKIKALVAEKLSKPSAPQEPTVTEPKEENKLEVNTDDLFN